MDKKDKEALRKELEKEGRKHKPNCPCCDKKMEYQGFVFFADPCICGSGKKFKNCCYKTLPKDF